MNKPVLSMTLWFLVIMGLFGALRLSYVTSTTDNDCPILVGIPVCYVILLGYALIAIAQFTGMPVKSRLFWIGWLPVFLLAITGTMLELVDGQTCPKNDTGLPLCYVSLAIIILIAICFLLINRPVTCRSKQ